MIFIVFVSFQSTINSLLAPSYTLLETMFPSLGGVRGGGARFSHKNVTQFISACSFTCA